eukprot:g743.t1
MSTLTIYIGANRSLLQVGEEAESLTMSDAGLFPVFGSAALLSLYITFKLFPAYVVNGLLLFYFMCVGTLALFKALTPIVRATLLQDELAGEYFSSHSSKSKKDDDKQVVFKKPGVLFSFTIPVPSMIGEPVVINPDIAELLAFFLSIVNAVLYFKTKHWCTNNIFGICFSLTAIESISLGSYQIGAVLLVALFFYDIFWVFGTDVMVSVAKNFDAPIKLIFPREFATHDTAAQFSMLGLGDIVMPGIFIAMLLRFDFRNSRPGNRPCTDVVIRGTSQFVRTYFNVALIFYALGLAVTVLVMYKFGAAQPALLYLVPACLIASMGTALVRGEFQKLWNFEDSPDASKMASGSVKNDDKKEEENIDDSDSGFEMVNGSSGVTTTVKRSSKAKNSN